MTISEDATNAYYSGNFENALSLYYRILAQDLNNSGNYYNIGLVYENLDELELAVSYYKKSIRLDGANVRSINNLARIYIEEIKDFETAKIYLDRAIEIAPTDAEAYNLYGNLSMLENDFDIAVAYFKKSIVLDEEYFKNYYDIALAYYAQDKIEEAKNNIKKSIELNQNFPKAQELLNEINNSKYPTR